MADLRSAPHLFRSEPMPGSAIPVLPVQKPHQAACTCRHRYCPRRIHAILGVGVGFYAIGVWAVCYHLANGLATSAMAWGITVTETSQRRGTLLGLGIGVALTLAGTAAWYAVAIGSQSG